MTLRNGVFFENNKTNQHAQDVRLMLKGLLGGVTGATSGVAHPDHFKVTEKSGTPDMSVDVAAGHIFIEGSRNSAQGVYHAYNDATVNVPLSASDPTNPRIDIIYVRLRDSAYDAGFDGEDDAEIVVAEGTPAAVPVAPTITDEDYIELARVAVGAGVSSIVNANITDLRVASSVWTAPRGLVGFAERSTDLGPFTTDTDLGLTVSAPFEPGRRYRLSAAAAFQSSVAGDHIGLQIQTGTGTVLAGAAGVMAVANRSVTIEVSKIAMLSAPGTVKLVCTRFAGTGNIHLKASGTLQAHLEVEDVGGFLL